MKRSTTEELRNAMGKLVAKWYPDEGVIEIVIKGMPLCDYCASGYANRVPFQYAAY